MKLLHLITRAEPGGAQTQVLSLIPGLQRHFDVTVATGEEGFLTNALHRHGIRTIVVPDLVHPLDPIRDARALKELAAIIRSWRPALVHAHTSKAGFLGRLASRLCGVPAVFSAHGWAFSDDASRGRRLVSEPLERVAARWSGAIITVCAADRELALRRRIARADKLHVVHNGLADCRWRAQPDASRRPVIVMVARFVPQKDPALLLTAASGLPTEFDLRLVGDGPCRRSAERLASGLGIPGSVSFLGWQAEVAPILARAHIFVLTSRFEGFPISVLEAMRAGLPVVASDVGGVREAVVEEETGFLVARGDHATLRERLGRLIADPALRARMGRAGRERFLRHFTVDRTVERTLSVYEHVLGVAFEKDRRSRPAALALPGHGLPGTTADGMWGRGGCDRAPQTGSMEDDDKGTWI